MSVGSLVVELKLEDGQYQASMRQAGKAAQTLSGNFNSLNHSVNSFQGGLSGTIPHLRDIAIITSSLHSIVSGISDTFGTLTRSFINANAEIERSTVLLQGLSKSIDMSGKIRDAAKDMDFLFETAKQAPFSLKELTNSFVKMRAVGLGDAEKKVRILSDAIANFGGDNEALHRTTVAIQQMASKGVISMEELRQQLGESVPNAMNMMADGMGLTMSSLIKNITAGKVRAIPAINGMMKEMDLSMAGSSIRMMETWSGMTSQLETNWMLLQRKIGNSGSFDALKNELKILNTFLQSNDALKYAQMFGDGMKSAIDTLHSFGKAFSDNKDMILTTGKALLELWAVTKLFHGFSNVRNAIAPIALRGEALSRLRPVTTSVESADFASGKMGGAITSTTGAMTAASALSAASVFLPGFWKTLPLLMTAAIVAYQSFGDTATHAMDSVIAKQNELDEKTKIGSRVDGDNAIKTIEDLNKVKENIIELNLLRDKAAINVLESKTQNAGIPVVAAVTSLFSNSSKDLQKNQEEYDSYVAKINSENRASAEAQAMLFEDAFKREKAAGITTLDAVFAKRTTNYKLGSDQINLEAQAMTDAGAIQKDIDDKKFQSKLAQQKAEFTDQLQNMEEIRKASQKTIDEMSSSTSGKQLLTFVDKVRLKKELEEVRLAAILEIAKIEVAIKNATDSGKKAELGEKLKIEQSVFSNAVTGLKELGIEIEAIQSNSSIDLNIVDNFAKAFQMLELIKTKVLGINKDLADNAQGKLASAGGINENNEKNQEAELKRINQALRQQLQRVAGNTSDLVGSSDKGANKIIVKFDQEGMSPEFFKAIENAQNNPSISQAVKEKLAASKEMLLDSRAMEGDGIKDIERARKNLEMAALMADSVKEQAGYVNEQGKIQDRILATEEKIKSVRSGKAEAMKSENLFALERERSRLPSSESSAGIDESIKLQKVEDLRQFELTAARDTATASKAATEKKLAEDEQFKNAWQANRIAIGKFENTLRTTELNEKRTMEAISSRDSVEIYNNQLENYKEVNRKQLENKYATTKKIYEDELDAKRMSQEIYDSKIAGIDAVIKKENDEAFVFKKNLSDEQEAQKAFDLKRAASQKIDQNYSARQVGTSNQKDLAAAKLKYDQSISNIYSSTDSKSPVMLKASLDTQRALYQDELKQIEYAHRTSFEKMAQDTVDFRQVAGDAATQFTNGMVDGFAQLATNGTTSFKQFTTTVLQGIAQMLVKMALLSVVQQAIGMYTGSSVKIPVGGQTAFANGGIMTSAGSVPLRAYSGGGIANSPQMALFGEGKSPEAFVPLPDGRSIPVTMKGAAGGGDTVTIQINVDNKGAATSNKQDGGAHGGNGDMWGKMAENIKGIVVQTINEQKRPGGQLYTR